VRLHAIFLALILTNLSATAVFPADRYKVNLTRKDRNLYKVDGTAFWVQTRYCYEYGYGEEAALNADEVVFLDDGEKCDVRRVLKESAVTAGNYQVSLTREDDNLYSTLDGTFVQTSMCLSLALGEDSILRMNGYGGGTVIFLDDGDKCDIEAVFSKVRL
jgi:hypothetical protein